jgi:Leucine Rich repeat
MPLFGRKKKEEKWRVELEDCLRDGSEDLNLAVEDLGDTEVVEIAERLLRSDNAVRWLSLDSNTMGDRGARAVAELLRSDHCALESVQLAHNNIGPEGIVALGEALRENTTVSRVFLSHNPGVEIAASIDTLVSAIGANTTLRRVSVGTSNPHQKTVDAVLAAADREQYGAGQLTKAAGKTG